MIYSTHNAIYHSYKNLIIVFIHFWVCGMNVFAIVNMKYLVIYVYTFYYLWLYFFFQIPHVKLEYIDILYFWKLYMLYIYYKPYGTKIRYTLWSQGMKSWIFIFVWLEFNIDGEPPLSFYFSFSSEKSLSWLASVMQVDMVFGISRKTFFIFK